MTEWIRKIGIGTIVIIMAGSTFIWLGNGNSYAESNGNESDEMEAAFDAFENMNDQSQQQMLASMNVSNTAGISSFDLETALMMIQKDRARLLDEQLQQQLSEVQARKNEIENIQNILNITRSELAEFQNGEEITEQETFNQLRFLYCTDLSLNSLTVEKMAACIEKLESLIESLSQSEQMDMLRLQALSDKRNEAYDKMSNFLKKMQDSRSGIIDNLR